MNISVIYGTNKNTCTYNCVQILLNSMKLTVPITVKEFFLDKELSDKSNKIFSCFIDNNSIQISSTPIDYLTSSLDSSDLVILASPVIQCDITTEFDSLLKHLLNKSIECNRNSHMNTKIGLVMCTTAGAGLSYTTKNLKKNLIFWGIHNIFRFSRTIYETNWEDVDIKTKLKINKRIFKLSNKILTKCCYMNTTFSNKLIPYLSKPYFKNQHGNVISINFKQNSTYTHQERKIH